MHKSMMLLRKQPVLDISRMSQIYSCNVLFSILWLYGIIFQLCLRTGLQLCMPLMYWILHHDPSTLMAVTLYTSLGILAIAVCVAARAKVPNTPRVASNAAYDGGYEQATRFSGEEPPRYHSDLSSMQPRYWETQRWRSKRGRCIKFGILRLVQRSFPFVG